MVVCAAQSWIETLIATGSILAPDGVGSKYLQLVLPPDGEGLVHTIRSFLATRGACRLVSVDLRTASEEAIYRSCGGSFCTTLHTLYLVTVDTTVQSIARFEFMRSIIDTTELCAVLVIAYKTGIMLEGTTITFPLMVTADMLYQLARMTTLQVRRIDAMHLYNVAQRYGRVSWSHGIALAPYAALLGKGTEEFADRWIDQLVMSRSALFLVSQHFFAKDRQSFYYLWVRLLPLYSQEFWLVYWSDLFWRAHSYIIAMREGGHDSTELSRGLPFNFVRSCWKRYDLTLLADAVERLSRYDIHSKQGGAIIPFDLLFQNFFSS